jgi:hypothetical protein
MEANKINAELLEACKSLLNSMRYLINQLPNDERLADYRIDACEISEQKAIEAIKNAEGVQPS